MAKNENRGERTKAKQTLQTENKSGLSKVYYWIIGILFVILLLLIVYIFANSGDNVKLGDEDEKSSIVQKQEKDEENNSSKDNKNEENKIEESEEEKEQEAEVDYKEETENSEDLVDEEDEYQVDEEDEYQVDEPKEDETVVNDNAPLDTSHAVDYSNGSADRVAIKNKVMEATGLGNDLIENWIGNNGPGRVTADVYSPDKSKIYRVYLQYGDGEWHVTDYEKLDSVPSN